ncbi:N-acetylmuramoyl-L-alanine amidase [Aquimarina intermedia]|uniref:Putative secreted protein (Por secretion system target) n=1 Tax=Aquimarina intermedia TaxID=350814 RepID=A0A5S5CFP3_9FLAO|nr:N-acetylmuramoyl-L-alanine amidase [Aquimarina intermedia]TYP77332.1 putative secreted protein (Por secretion system target) [Aquimarina intermedia]
MKPVKINLKKPKPFISVYTVWEGINLAYTSSKLSYRTSKNGKSWSAWETAVFDGHQEQTSSRITSKMMFLDKKTKYIQYKVSFDQTVDDMTLTDVQLFHYSPGKTPKTTQKNILQTTKSQARAVCSKPTVVSRSQWGAIYRNPASTSTVSHLILHHEYGSNSSNDWAARVRSIQNYHINGNGWSDIGYNFLVDPNGTIYEGRAGGDNAIGAHFCGKNRNTMGICMLGDYSSISPTAATQTALKDLLAWKANKETIDPLGASYHYSVNASLKHIAGHRDAGCTVCPGNGGYASMPSIRNGVNLLVSNGCSGDTTPPTTSITAVGGNTQTGDFTVNFSDNDNIGVTRRFYQVLEKYGTSYLANRTNGFFNENFDQDFGVYDKGAGSWTVTNGRLNQTNTTSDNTLWSSYLIQDSGLPYLYEFAAKVTSTTGPRKFGMHIMASDATLSQRGNSYLIWFSGEDNKVRIYETVNNALYTRAIADVSLDNNWAAYRVTYSPAYGVLQVWKNKESLLTWVDSSPIPSGVAISLRTNKTSVLFDDVKVSKFRSTGSALITAGSLDNTNDLRTTNGKIKSMVRDEAGNWSQPGNLDITLNTAGTLARTQPSSVTLYPNEVSDKAILAWNQREDSAVEITIYDTQGNLISKLPKSYIPQGQGNLDISTSTNQLSPGLYILNLSTGTERETIKLLKK